MERYRGDVNVRAKLASGVVGRVGGFSKFAASYLRRIMVDGWSPASSKVASPPACQHLGLAENLTAGWIHILFHSGTFRSLLHNSFRRTAAACCCIPSLLLLLRATAPCPPLHQRVIDRAAVAGKPQSIADREIRYRVSSALPRPLAHLIQQFGLQDRGCGERPTPTTPSGVAHSCASNVPARPWPQQQPCTPSTPLRAPT